MSTGSGKIVLLLQMAMSNAYIGRSDSFLIIIINFRFLYGPAPLFHNNV